MNRMNCSDCHNPLPIPPVTGGTGYAILPDTKAKICYPCSDKRQIEDLRDRTKPFMAYVSGLLITSWTGGVLMHVTRRNTCKLTRPSWTHDRRSYCSVHAVDVHGGHWTGRGSDGVAIRLRPCKACKA